MSRRVLFLGFDSMDAGVARALVDDGKLPALRAQWERSAWAPTENPPGLVVGAVWPTIWSAVPPSRHGFYGNWQLPRGTYELKHTTPFTIGRPPFWAAVAAAGRRVSVLDVPLVPLHDLPGGVHVADWGSHDRMLSPSSTPAIAIDDVRACVGAYAVAHECDVYARDGALDELHRALLAGITQKTAATAALLRDPDVDLIISVFSESHCAGHHFWPTFGTADDVLADVYESLDRALGELVELAGPDTILVVLLSHGIQSPHGGDHLLAEVLRRLDDAYGAPGRLLAARERVWRRIERRRHQRAFERSNPDHPEEARLISVDSARRFFKLPSVGLHSYVRFNVVGREPRGRVRRGADLDELATNLEKDLRDLVDPDSGSGAVARVLRTSELYAGERLDDLPDLLVEWDPDMGTSVASDRVGLVAGEPWRGRVGEHRAPGAVFVSGPGITAGRLAGEVRSDSLGATVCAMLGVDAGDMSAPIDAFSA